jgi:uncharacterized integral membrane protein
MAVLDETAERELTLRDGVRAATPLAVVVVAAVVTGVLRAVS